MRRIYTKTGDRGTTGIHGGERVPKDDIRIEANGCLDELNCQIGIVRSLLEAAHDWQTILQTIQQELMVAMSLVATPSAIRERNPNQFSGQVVATCEREMDRLMPLIEDKDYFILPGGTPIAAQLQMARAIARRAERRLWLDPESAGSPARGDPGFPQPPFGPLLRHGPLRDTAAGLAGRALAGFRLQTQNETGMKHLIPAVYVFLPFNLHKSNKTRETINRHLI